MKRKRRIFRKAPFIISAMFCYVGAYMLLNFLGYAFDKSILYITFYLVVFSSVFAYGVLSIVDDFKSGGIAKIIERINRKINE